MSTVRDAANIRRGFITHRPVTCSKCGQSWMVSSKLVGNTRCIRCRNVERVNARG